MATSGKGGKNVTLPDIFITDKSYTIISVTQNKKCGEVFKNLRGNVTELAGKCSKNAGKCYKP